MKEGVKFVSVLLVSGTMIVGCGTTDTSSNNSSNNQTEGTTSSSAPVNITVWNDYSPGTPTGKYFQKMVDNFNQSHPQIHVTAQYISTGDEMLPKIMTALAGNQEPDLVAGGYPTWGPGLMGSQKVVDLTSYLNSSKTLRSSDFLPGMLQVSSYKGDLLSIPNDGGDYSIFYNKEMFKQAGLDPNTPPTTWDQLTQDSIQIKQKTGNWGFYVPIGQDEWTVWTFEGMLWGNGGTFIDTSGDKAKVEFNSPAGVQALQTWIDMIHKYKVSPSVAFPNTELTSQMLTSGKTAMVIGGGSDVAQAQEANVPFGTFMFPKGTDNYSTNLGTDAFFVFKTGSEKQQASWKFIEWFMQPSNLAQWDIDTSYLPTTKSAESTATYQQYLQKTPQLKPLVDNLKYAHARPTLISYNAISAELGTEIEAALYGKISAQQALDEAAKQAESILAQNNE